MTAVAPTLRFDRAAIMRAAWRRVRVRKGDVQDFGLRHVLRLALRAEWAIARTAVEAARTRATWAALRAAQRAEPVVAAPVAPLTPAQMRREVLLSKDAPLTAADVAELRAVA